MKRTKLTGLLTIAIAGSSLLAATRADAATLRYRQSGNWTTLSPDGAAAGWVVNGSNAVIGAQPGIADDTRINFGGNTVTVDSNVGTVRNVQIGVDEDGNVIVANGGVLSADLDVLAGNNNANATGTLTVQNGGTVNVGRILWAAQTNSDGVINVEQGGVINVASHLWWGVTGTANITINGTVNQTGGILGMGTSDAVNATGGTALVEIGDNGVLSLNNISGGAGTPSIQAGSSIDITGTGQLRVLGDQVGSINNYILAGEITGNGIVSNADLVVDLTTNPGFTTVYLVPEPSSLALIGLGGLLIARRRRG